MAGLNKFLCCAVVILIPTVCFSAVLPEPDEIFRKNGFQYLGTMNKDDTAGVSAVRTNLVSLWLSPEDHRESQFGAVLKCRSLYGSLLHILTDSQYDEVHAKILGVGEPIWTSGMYDEGQEKFAWFTLKSLPVDQRYIRSENGCSQANPGIGLAVQGFMSTFGLCSTQQDSHLRYICAL